MTKRKVFINADNQATFVCPECQRSSVRDVSQYTHIDKAVRVKCQCECGHSYFVSLERRKHYRKEISLPGIFKSQAIGRGQMTIKDISRFGLKFEVKSGRCPYLDEVVIVEFYLDDSHNTFISKEAVIKKVHNMTVGAEFCSINSSNQADRRLGFYLMP